VNIVAEAESPKFPTPPPRTPTEDATVKVQTPSKKSDQKSWLADLNDVLGLKAQSKIMYGC